MLQNYYIKAINSLLAMFLILLCGCAGYSAAKNKLNNNYIDAKILKRFDECKNGWNFEAKDQYNLKEVTGTVCVTEYGKVKINRD